jgi:NAD(P)-dependent dehydrogenase (short-subunit alcohol dehydrogenase family)
MSVELAGRTCVVTGAGGSIGRGIAGMYAALGARVAMIDLAPAVLDAASRLAAGGAVARGYTVDVGDRSAVADCFQRIARDLGNVFALVNAAGVVDQQPLEEITPERLERIHRVNINGSLWCSQAAVKTMRAWHDGRIIHFSSKSGKTGSALMAAYSGAKGAIISITHAMAYELARDNIKVNCLCPGIVEASGVWDSVRQGYVDQLGMDEPAVIRQFTSKVPLGRLCRVDDLVAFVRFLTVDGDYCTGQAFNITGGREMH